MGEASLLTIVLFFIYTFGLGFTLSNLLKIKGKKFYEKFIMNTGIGLAVFAVLTALIPLLRIPLDWKIILLLSIIYPIYHFFKNHKSILEYFKSQEFKKEIRPTLTIIILFILFGFTFFMYYKGAFSYPYFEDDDPWDHAITIKYIATEKTVYEPSVDSYLFSYLDARPPAYDAILAVLHQTSPSLMWTIKFFNALIISLGIFFFFYFARRVFNSSNKALLAAFFLAMFPTYLTHFIWSHALVMTLIFVGLYALLGIDEGWNNKIIAMFVISSVFVTQETQSIKYIFILGLFFLARTIVKRRFDFGSFYTILGAGLISSIIWWIPMALRYGGLRKIYTLGIMHGRTSENAAASFIHPSIGSIKSFGVLGSATRQHGIYTLKDILFAKGQNMINVPIGVGVILISLIIVGVIYLIIKNKHLLKAKTNELTLLFWFIFVFFGSHGGTRWWSPVALFTFRFWLLFAVFGSLVAVYGVYLLFSLFKSLNLSKNILSISKIVILILIILGVWFTSGAQKYELNTAQWPAGGRWTSVEELQGYLWLDTLPLNTPVFEAGGWGESIGMNKYHCRWCADEIPYYNELYKYDNDQINSLLTKKNYEYLIIIPGKAIKNFNWTINETEDLIRSLAEDDRFTPTFSNQGFFAFKVD
jgi:hypothetical protein